jgi:hypothetical protein
MSFRTAAVFLLFTVGFAANAECQDAGSAVFVTNSRFLKCTPGTLKGTQPLVLTLGHGHGQDLAIRRVADDTWYYLVTASPEPPLKLLMSRQAFSEARQLVIPIDMASYQWTNGKAIKERVFSKPGQYIVYTSDNLESEDPGYKCTINYAPPDEKRR